MNIKIKIEYKMITVIFFLILNTCFNSLNLNAAETSKEEDIKAVFIYNFTKYFKWKKDQEVKTFNIYLLGKSDLIKPLKLIAKKKKVWDNKIIVRQINDINKIGYCHVLFISEINDNKLKVILKKLKSKNILTISDSKGFAKSGVAINFIKTDGKIRFEVNTTALKNAGFKLSSQLLKLAVIVE